MQFALKQYDGGDIHPYFQSSLFLPSPRWASSLREEAERRNLNIQWRCETRADAMLPETVEHLAAAGLKVIDLGLEAASPRQILAMGKSKNVDRYLRSASNLLAACKANGIWVKANVLLYAGETAQTIDETRAWLDQHSDAIKGVSVGPVVVFGPPRHSRPMLEELTRSGARAVEETASEQRGITSIHLSHEIDCDAAETIALDLSKRYMDEDAYFDLKAFSYYPRQYRRADFDSDVLASDAKSLPFRLKSASVDHRQPR